MIGDYCGVRFVHDDVGPVAARAEMRVPRDVTIPVIEDNFTSRFHPGWRELRETTWSWASSLGMWPPGTSRELFESWRMTDIVAEFALGAPVPVLETTAMFSVWLFLWDDRQEDDFLNGRDSAWTDAAASMHAALDEPEKAAMHRDPLVRAISDVVRRLSSSLTPAWNARFTRHLHDSLDSYQRDYRHRRAGDPPLGVQEYLRERRLTFASYVWIDLIEQAAQRDVQDASPLTALYRQAAITALDCVALYNDLTGLKKELAAGETANLVISIAHHTPCSFDEARSVARDMVIRKVEEFLWMERRFTQLLPFVQEEPDRSAVAQCMLNARGWISVVYWFQNESTRYCM